jgi:AbrB family looped-hinge helix DNA binding protein
MQTPVTKRGQTVIPTSIRRRQGIREGDRPVWPDEGQTIKVVPVGGNPVGALRGCGTGERLAERLPSERREDRARER